MYAFGGVSNCTSSAGKVSASSLRDWLCNVMEAQRCSQFTCQGAFAHTPESWQIQALTFQGMHGKPISCPATLESSFVANAVHCALPWWKTSEAVCSSSTAVR